MDDDRTLAALREHSERGRPRGAATLHQDAVRGIDDYVREVGHLTPGGRQRPLRVAVLALAAVVIAAALVIGGVLPGREQVRSAARAVLGADRGPYDDLLDRWLAEYDPAERQHLREMADPGFGEITKQYEVGTLEFRRTCRKLSAAIDAAEGAAPADRSDTVHGIMDPQLKRSDERDRITALADGSTPLGPGQGAMWEAWHAMTDEVAEGNFARARSIIDGDCRAAFGPWVDR